MTELENLIESITFLNAVADVKAQVDGKTIKIRFNKNSSMIEDMTLRDDVEGNFVDVWIRVK